MIYSKLLKPSDFLACRLSVVQKFYNDGRPYMLKNNFVVSSNSGTYNSCSRYSTILHSKLPQCQKLSPKFRVLSLNSSAFLSTNGNNEKYQIIVTNPQGSTSTLNSPLGSSANEIKSAEVLPTPGTNITSGTDVATSLGTGTVTSPGTDIATSLGTGTVTSPGTDIATSLSNELATVADVLEPSFSSIGLAHWTPAGIVQMFLEYLHITMHWPWWLTIITCTVIARILCFPLILKTQKNAIYMSNHMPQLQYLQAKFGEARRTGNSMEASRYASEMALFMKEKKINPIKTAMFPMLQAPIFLSFFFALRGMAKAPVESMKTGGLSWVTDLTIPDPYYVLPVVACGTMYIVLKIGAESGMRMDNMKLAKYFLTALPVIAIPFCIHFPSAILYYWCTNNFCTLITVSVLKIQPVRDYFNLPKQNPINPKYLLPNKGFIKGVKEAYEDQKVLANIEDRRRVDDIRFQKAGTGPIPRTYSYDPTKPRPSNVASITNRNVAAKEHSIACICK